MKKLTLSVDPETTERFDFLKKIYGFRSRGKFFDNLVSYIYGLERVRLLKCLSPEEQDRIASMHACNSIT